MAGCNYIKGNGERCQLAATGENGLCWGHDPANAEQRRRMASKAGKSRTGGEVKDLKQEVRDLIAAVKAGEQDRSDAAVMLQGYRVLKDYLELERKGRDLDELLERLEALEERSNARRAG